MVGKERRVVEAGGRRNNRRRNIVDQAGRKYKQTKQNTGNSLDNKESVSGDE